MFDPYCRDYLIPTSYGDTCREELCTKSNLENRGADLVKEVVRG
jgi:hypothetical protein